MKTHRRVLATLLLFLMTIMTPLLNVTSVYAEKQQVIRVGFPQVPGFSSTDKYGNRKGLVVDYLNEIAKYTGWEYEYIDVEPADMLERFENKEFDLLGGMYYLDQVADRYGYPKYNTGYSKIELLARKDDDRIRSYDIESLQGKTIGVYDRSTVVISYLEKFLEMHGLNCEIRKFSVDESVNGSLDWYLTDGTVDLLVANAGRGAERFRSVVSFDAQPHYIVTQADQAEILAQLNSALKCVYEGSPDFAEEHYRVNFPELGTNKISLNEAEKEYVKDVQKVRVAMVKRYHPFFCPNSPDGSHRGIVPEVLDRVTEFCGLNFEYVYADTYGEAIELVKQGKAEILSFYLGTEKKANREGLVTSDSYSTMYLQYVKNKSVDFTQDGLVCALPTGHDLRDSVKGSKIYRCYDTTEALRAVNEGKADFTYHLAVRLEEEFQKRTYPNINAVAFPDSPIKVRFALKEPANPCLLTILDKTVNQMTEEEKAELIHHNFISDSQKFSVTNFLYSNPFFSIGLIVLISFMLIVLIIGVFVFRMKTAQSKFEVAKAEAANEAKSMFLSQVSHDIRTPINAIVGMLDIIERNKGNQEKMEDCLSKINVSTVHLLTLINDVLDLNKLESGKLEIINEPIDLVDVLGEVEELLQPSAKHKGVSLSIDTSQMKQKRVLSSDRYVRQIVVNLISNGIKYNKSGGYVKVVADEKMIDLDEKKIIGHLQVSDNGIGMSKKFQEHMFDLFAQEGAVSNNQNGGFGVGLAIVKQIVDLMDGELTVKSEEGVGTTFDIFLPLEIDLHERKNKEPERENQELLKGKRILAVEDNELNLEIVETVLKGVGCEVTTAADGKEAVEAFANSSEKYFDVILMDIRMPVMDGWRATEIIREMEREDAKTVPIIAMSANAFAEDIAHSKEVGMNEHLAKPINMKRLLHYLCEL